MDPDRFRVGLTERVGLVVGPEERVGLVVGTEETVGLRVGTHLYGIYFYLIKGVP